VVAGEIIVTDGLDKLQNGTKVAVQPAQAAAKEGASRSGL
jgi:hypothetical protein